MRRLGNWAWVDVETSGLDAQKNALLEIAVLVTDRELNVLDEFGFHAIVQYSATELDAIYSAAVPFVQEMHTTTGLWGRLAGEHTVPLERIDSALRAYLASFGDEPRTMPVAGNSVRLDMNFLDVNLPTAAAFLDYHMRDVSTISGIADDWFDASTTEGLRHEKHSDHTAMTDIRESIRELRHWRRTVFATRGQATYNAQDAQWSYGSIEGDPSE